MIDEIAIKNFKSIKDAHTKFPKYIGAIVGKNAAGKTNLIQAINFVRNLSIGISIGSAFKKIALTPQEIYNYNDSSADIDIKIKVSSGDDFKYLLEIVISRLNEEQNIENLFVKTETLQKISSSNTSTIIYKRSGSNITDKDGGKIPLSVEPDKLAVSQYQNEDALRVKSLFSNVFVPEQDSIDFRESIVKSDDKGLASLVVRLRKNETSFEEFQKIIKKLLPHFSSLVEIVSNKENSSSDNEKLFMILLEEENLKGKLSMKSISTGDLRTLYLIASAIYLKPSSSFIFEEIENGLHSKRLNDLLDNLTTISRKKDMQILFTTHSSAVINIMAPQQIVYVEKESNGTNFYLLSEGSHIEQIDKALKEGISLNEYILSRMQ